MKVSMPMWSSEILACGKDAQATRFTKLSTVMMGAGHGNILHDARIDFRAYLHARLLTNVVF